MKKLAIWSQDRGRWEDRDGQIDLFSEHSEPFSAVWPSSGTTRNGVAYELPTPALPTVGIGSSSSLLKTPTSQLAINGGSQHPDKRKAGGHGPTLADEVEHLLPTPAAMNPNDGEGLATWEARRQRVKLTAKNGNGFGTPLAIAVQLLPTPVVTDSAGTRNATANRSNPNSRHHGGYTLTDVLLPTPMASEGAKATTLQGSAEKGLTGQVWLTNVAHDPAVLNGALISPRSNQRMEK